MFDINIQWIQQQLLNFSLISPKSVLISKGPFLCELKRNTQFVFLRDSVRLLMSGALHPLSYLILRQAHTSKCTFFHSVVEKTGSLGKDKWIS